MHAATVGLGLQSGQMMLDAIAILYLLGSYFIAVVVSFACFICTNFKRGFLAPFTIHFFAFRHQTCPASVRYEDFYCINSALTKILNISFYNNDPLNRSCCVLQV